MTPRFATLFRRQILRSWWRRPLLPLLNILCVAVGVAVFVAVQIANRSALASFQNAVALVAGRAHLEARGDLPENVLPVIASQPGVKSATPLVEGVVTLPDKPGEYLRILGVDPFTGGDLRVFQLESASGGDLDLEAWLREPRAIAVSREAALSGPVRVLAAGRSVELVPMFALRSEDAAVRSDPRVVAMDVGWAQQLLDMPGRLTSVQILLDDPLRADEVATRIARVLPADASVGPPARRGAETEQMLAAFQLNLTALSLVSMVVGVFLIYNSLSAAVVRRRVDLGILRAAGATKAEVALLFVAEALVAGFLGTVLGIIAAGPLAALLANPVGQTVSSLYTLVSVGELAVTPSQVLLAFAVGLPAACVAALRPAYEAASTDPAIVLRSGSLVDSARPRLRRWTLLGAVALVLAAALSWWSLHGGGDYLGFAAVGLLIAGTSLVVPAAVAVFARLVRGPGWIVRLSAQHLLRAVHRNAITIAALAIAAGMTVSVSVMIDSFRASVSSWVARTLVADLFIAPAANEIAGLQSFMPPETVAWSRKDPRVAEVATFRELNVRADGHTTALGILDGRARGDLEFLAALPDAAGLFHERGHVVVSESLANRRGIRPGDRISLATPHGGQSFLVAGVVKDFTRDSGLILMDRRSFSEYWQDDRVHSLAIKLRNPRDAEELGGEFRRTFGAAGEFSIYTNAALRGRVMEIFDQTFAVTGVLRAISVLVAVAGVFLSLSILVIERSREIGVLRSQGASRGQVRALVITEAGMIGSIASVLGVACGAAMAMILTWVINKAFFGWTIELRYPVEVLASTPLWLVPAALAAGWIPALRAGRVPPAQALRFE